MSNDGTESQGASIVKGCLAIFVVVLVVTWACVAWATSGDSPAALHRAPTFSPSGSHTTDPPSRTLEETAFLYTLHDGGEEYDYTGRTDAALLQTGRRACSSMDAGTDILTVASDISEAYDLGISRASYLVGDALGTICPNALGDPS